MRIWLNDSLVEASTVELSHGGWPLGEGIFETIKTINGRPILLSRHMRRALGSGRRIRVKVAHESLVRVAVQELLDSEPHISGRLRLLFSNKEFIATHHAYEEQSKSADVMIAKSSAHISGLKDKTFPYTSRLELLSQARDRAFDEVLCIRADGQLTEGAVSNFIFRIAGQWVTPPISVGILPGVTRALVIENFAIQVRPVAQGELSAIDASFALSSLKIAQPVRSIAGRNLLMDEESISMGLKISEIVLAHSVD